MSGYTKGPWSIRPGVFNYQTEIMSGEDVLATVYGNTGENLGNANVMAAAPELLEALEECEQVMADPFKYGETCISDAIAKARAAIAKAKGEA